VSMKTLVVDLEMMPMLSYHWSRWKENLSLPQTIHESYLASYAAKWLHSDEMFYDGLDNYSMSMADEEPVTRSLWKLLDEADAIITFNGDRFDIKKANTAFVKYGMWPPSPFQSIDLIKVVKKKFANSSNSMKSWLSFLGMENKQEVDGWKLWVACVNKDPEAWKLMQSYNKQDVIVTENLYKRLLPWISNHANMGLFEKEDAAVCTNCGSDKLHQPRGSVYTRTGKYKRYQCKDCGTHMRGRTTTVTKEKRDTLLVGV